jgi:hypothetical protein
MRAIRATLCVCLAVAASGSVVRTQDAQADDVPLLLRRLELLVQKSDSGGYLALLADSADRDRATDFSSREIPAGITRAVIQERDRAPLAGTLPGNGYQLTIDVFEEFGDRARESTWRLDVKRVGTAGSSWLISDAAHVTSVENLYRLSLNPAKRFAVHDLRISDEDLELTLAEGAVYVSDIDQGTTGVVLLGNGTMTFHPAPDAEKGQVRIFAGAERLQSRFDVAYLRLNPADFARVIDPGRLVAAAADPRELRRAEGAFREESTKSYSIDLGDLSRDPWSLVPAPGDLVAEVRTRRFDTLTYVRSGNEPEDVTLFDRKRHRNISVYTSQARLETRGRFYNDEELTDYDVLHYDIDLTASPDREWIDARTRVDLKVRATATASITMRLADSLVVQSIISKEFGRLFGVRVKNQNSLVINLPAAVLRDTPLSVTIAYAGRLEPQVTDRETLAVQGEVSLPDIALTAEPSILYSNRTYWYPQSMVSDFATATLRLNVPANIQCVASGDPDPSSPAVVPGPPGRDAPQGRQVYTFTAAQPLRYLAFVMSRFAPATATTISFPAGPLNLSVEANPRQVGRGRNVGDSATDIALYYQSLLADTPYPSFTVAMTESDLPGGHSPAYFAVLNQPLATSPYVWRNDPAAFDNYPDFFLAHEMAHQWWGQAVGWRNYHEQWLSEGFAQYFAALYAQHRRGDAVFGGMLQRMQKWAVAESDQGPIALGYRLGHIRSDSRIFRAVVYDKGALVLHMLRRLVGDEAFFRGLRRFYRTSRFLNAGTEDFRLAMEEETGRLLTRFFDRWIYGSTLPHLTFSYKTDGTDVVLRAEQIGELFDVPLTVTLQYSDKRQVNVVLPVTDRTAELRVALTGTLRSVNIAKDDGGLAQIVKVP